MQRIGDASENEVVLSFLRAELGSARWRQHILNALAALDAPETLVSAGNPLDELENGLRRRVLGAYRGYPDKSLFAGFPSSVSWGRYALDQKSRNTAIYLNHGSWTLIARTRSVRQTAAAIAAGDVPESRRTMGENARAAAAALAAGQAFEDPILVHDASGPLVILEGNTRMTAYQMTGAARITALVGSSWSMASWVCYR